MNDIKRKKHKQNKYFTIMLIPYSGSKTRSLKIPHWFSYFALALSLSLVSYLTFSFIRNNYFEQMVQTYNSQLIKFEFEKNNLETKKQQLENEKILLNEKNIQFEHNLTEIEEQYSWKLDELRKQMKEVEAKIEEIEEEKIKIYDKISKNINISNEFLSSAVGGAYAIESSSEYVDKTSHKQQQFELELLSLKNTVDRLKQSFDFLDESADQYKSIKEGIPAGLPVHGAFTSQVGWRNDPFESVNTEFHSGLDIKVPSGTDVSVTANGQVTFSGYSNGYGYLVKVKHLNGFETYYAHNSKLLVSVNDYVKKGDIIAKSGSTGRSTGPHVHYEVRLNGEIKNPLDYK